MRNALLIFMFVFSLPVSAGYTKDIMEPWMGATRDEVVAQWGYPQAATDIINIDDKTTVYTYRSKRGGFGGQLECVVSFTFTNNIVTGFKYEGGHCPRHKRNPPSGENSK